MKNVTLLFAFIFLANFSEAQVSVNWNNYPGGTAITTNSNNDVYTVRWDNNPGGDINLTKRDSVNIKMLVFHCDFYHHY